jgi:predicted DNA-binding protein
VSKVYSKLSPLEVPPELKRVLDEYSELTGVPKAEIRKEILYKFFAPYIRDPELLRRLQEAHAATLAAAAADRATVGEQAKNGSDRQSSASATSSSSTPHLASPHDSDGGSG